MVQNSVWGFKTGLLIGGLLCTVAFSAIAQTEVKHEENIENNMDSKAWEIGVGGTVLQFNRIHFSNFAQLENGSYTFNLGLRNALWGGNVYLAKELNKHLYFDLQGNVGLTHQNMGGQKKNKWMFMVQPGLQWRLGEYWGSKYIDPYLRVGVGYMYKGFDINYIGTEGLTSGEMQWILDNYKNKDGIDRTNMMPVSAGAGLNMWLNDRFGIGMQADYVVMPYEDVANSLQGTVRLMWRIGGKTKKAAPVYRERIVERIVERVVEKPVIETVEVVKRDTLLSGLFQNINFEFDKSVLTPSSYDVIDKIARILKKDPDKRFLITGYTDAKGTPEYNLSLSKNRAETVVNALIDKGVPEYMLKPRGVGMKISYANSNASDDIREADRKVTIEIISNAGYWDYIQSK